VKKSPDDRVRQKERPGSLSLNDRERIAKRSVELGTIDEKAPRSIGKINEGCEGRGAGKKSLGNDKSRIVKNASRKGNGLTSDGRKAMAGRGEKDL